MIILRVLGGLAIVVAGTAMVFKSSWIMRTFGRSPWAEKHLGTYGGSVLLYKLLGMLAIAFGFLLAANLLQPIALAIFKPLFGIRD